MGSLHPSFPPRWTLPGREGVVGTWGTLPKLATPAIPLANAATPAFPAGDAVLSSASPSPWGETGRAGTSEIRCRALVCCRELLRPHGDEPGINPPRAAAGAGGDALVCPDKAGHERRRAPATCSLPTQEIKAPVCFL